MNDKPGTKPDITSTITPTPEAAAQTLRLSWNHERRNQLLNRWSVRLMRVTVFGATGAIGKLLVTHLLAGGDEVTAYVRPTTKIPAGWTNKVRVVVGLITDATAIDRAIEGAEAVASALGPDMNRQATGLPLVTGTQLILESMKRHGVGRYVGNGTPSVLDARDKATFQTRFTTFVARKLLPRAHEEMAGMSKQVMTSGLDWTIVRFFAPKDGAAKGVRRVGFFGSARIGFGVTRDDIAKFTADQIHDPTYSRAAPAISN